MADKDKDKDKDKERQKDKDKDKDKDKETKKKVPSHFALIFRFVYRQSRGFKRLSQ